MADGLKVVRSKKSLIKEMKKAGVKLPHGYEVRKRTAKKKKIRSSKV